MKIGVLGGTFDPIHFGHLTLAEEAQTQLGLAKVLFIPTYLPPHKSRPDLSPAGLRYRMTALAIKNHPTFEISDLEMQRKKKSYTVETLKALRKSHPLPAELYFLIGADMLSILPEWKKPEELFALATFVVANRPQCELEHVSEEVISLAMPPLDVSSSMIRDRVRQGQSIASLVPTKVEEFITQHHLYRARRTP